MNISLLKNKEVGKRCFILANGPSVNGFDLNKLKNEIVIGMNASPILEHAYDFRHNYYTLSDVRFLKDPNKFRMATEYVPNETIKVLRKELKVEYPDSIGNVAYVSALERDGFSFNLKEGYCYGRTTVMLSLQLACYLGCREIYLLGFDLTYDPLRPRFYKEKKIQIDDAQASIQIFNVSKAYKKLEKIGVSLYNCNPDSLARNYLPYMNYEDIFNNINM